MTFFGTLSSAIRKISLQTKILLLVGALTASSTSILISFDSISLRNSVQQTAISQLDGMTTAINGRYEESHSIEDVQQIFDYIQYKNENVLQLTLYGETEILASTDRSLIGRPTPPGLLERLRESEALASHVRGEADGRPADLLTAPLKEDGVTIGAIELLIDSSDSLALIRTRILLIVIVGLSIGAILLAALSLIIRKMLIRPLLAVREAALSVKQGMAYKDIELDASQEIQEVASAFNDIVHNLENRYRELKETQAHLVESEKMVALGQLVAGVSHEINTPIGVGVTAITYLDEKTKKFRTLYRDNTMKRSDLEEYLKSVEESAGIIHTNLARASELIRSFKQVAVDTTAHSLRHFKLKPYIEDVVFSLQPHLKRTKLSVSVTGDDFVELYTDPGSVSQMITNFVMNSIIHAYAPDETGSLTIDVERRGRQVFLRYADDGKGMTTDVVERIFNPFFTTNRAGGGTGLGLHIVYNLVTQSLGGAIRCVSEPGKGTAFIVTIPTNKE